MIFFYMYPYLIKTKQLLETFIKTIGDGKIVNLIYFLENGESFL